MLRLLAYRVFQALLRTFSPKIPQSWHADQQMLLSIITFVLSLIFRATPTEIRDAATDWRRRCAPYFCHIDLNNLGRADWVRIPLQGMALLVLRPRYGDRGAGMMAFITNVEHRLVGVLVGIARRIDRGWAQCRLHAEWSWKPSPSMGDRLIDSPVFSSPARRWAMMGLGGVSLLFAASVPMSPAAQAIFGAFVLASVVMGRRVAHPLGRTSIALLTLLLGVRYFSWRIGATLPATGQIDLTLGVLLLLAELVLWYPGFVMLTGFCFSPSRLLAARESAVALLRSMAWLVVCSLPAVAAISGRIIIDATFAEYLIYVLPYLLGGELVAGMVRPSVRVWQQRESELATLSQSLCRRPFTGFLLSLAWLNAAALLLLVVQSLGGAESADGFQSITCAWVAVMFLMLVMAVGFERAPAAQFETFSGITFALAGGFRYMVICLVTIARTATGSLFRPMARFEHWLPRRPVFASLPLMACLFLLIGAIPAQVNAARKSSVDAIAAVGDDDANKVRRTSLRELSGFNTLSLRNTDGSASAYFGSRADELITRLTLVIRYSHSPALLPKDSHIKVLLNDEVIGIMPVDSGGEGRPRTSTFEVDPRFVADNNHLKFQLVGHYAQSCEDPLRTSLWASISGTSEVVTEYTELAINNDLSVLPEPFFDRRDLRQITVPMVFSSQPALPTVNAAGVVASWFGKLAGERGARFPANTNVVPPGHGLVVATNSDRPDFLRGHPRVDGPTIEIMTNPTDGRSKLLLILGRDGNDIMLAAQSLALGHVAMTGGTVTIRSRRDSAARQPYDAPNWVRSDRPTRFAEISAYPQQLQASGHAPPPLKLDLKIPPDIFSIGGRGVPVRLRYRHSPPARAGESLLNVSVNGQLVQSLALTAGAGNEAKRFVPGDNALSGEERNLRLPLHKLRGGNQMQFAFAFARVQEGACPDIPPDEARRALIDPDSTVDLSSFYHFARMPNLNHFASVGFPFTKYADLSETVLVLPDHPKPQEIEAAMNLLGYLSRSTGVAASRIRIAGPGEEAVLENADLLVVGSAIEEGVFKRWADYLPATLHGEVRRISHAARAENALYDWLGLGTEVDTEVVSQEKLSAEGPLAMLMGFESPFSPGRSVVVVTASAPDQLWMGVAALGNPKLSDAIRGSVSFVRGERVDSLLVGSTYLSGDLPWWVLVWLPLSYHPMLLALLTIAVVIMLSLLFRRMRSTQDEGLP